MKSMYRVLAAAAILVMPLTTDVAVAELRWDDLNATRLVRERDWLALKLEVLGLRLSYPAYRIEIALGEDTAFEFTLLASGGLAQHLTEEADRPEAERVLTYHAEGIREQVEGLLQKEFPDMWATYDRAADFSGTFLGPGESWDDPPRALGSWQRGTLVWASEQ